ncbi:MAG: hypothetical protein BWY68_00762 [bacterium ADurb.Bin400]|nr:MAG: hypothetical protein BWY68_00762 [bacterium ADurb.Bin400]
MDQDEQYGQEGDKEEMTVKEAGRLGGKKVQRLIEEGREAEEERKPAEREE